MPDTSAPSVIVKSPSPLATRASVCPSAPPRSALTVFTPEPVRSVTVAVSAPPRENVLTVSTPARSMTMLAMLRVKRARSPLAET